MSLWKIAWRSIQQRALASFLTSFSMALGVMLVVAVLVIYQVVQVAFHRGGEGYDLIVGPNKGSDLELVLSNLFYIGQQKATLPYSVYLDLESGKYLVDSVRTVVPICLGDQFKGQLIVGTMPRLLNEITYFENTKYEFAEGQNYDEKDFFGAVVGATAAQRAGLKIGDSFTPSHEVGGKDSGESNDASGDENHHRPFHIVGILKPTGTPNDNVIFVNIEGFFRIGGHSQVRAQDADADHAVEKTAATAAAKNDTKAVAKQELDHEHEHNHDEAISDSAKRVSAVLVCTTSELKNLPLRDAINRSKEAEAALPTQVISNFLSKFVGNLELVLLLFAAMIVVVASISILVSIYNSMNDRRHEIAIMRALGGSRATVMLVILFESILLSLGGGFLGLLLGHSLIVVSGPWIAEQMSLPLSRLQFRPEELVIIPCLIVLASIVGYLPAVSAYRTDVGRALAANP